MVIKIHGNSEISKAFDRWRVMNNRVMVALHQGVALSPAFMQLRLRLLIFFYRRVRRGTQSKTKQTTTTA